MNLDEHIGILIRNADMAIANYVKNQLAPFNLAPEQNLIMMMLWKKDGISPNEIAIELHKDKANIARMIASLEKKGFIRRVGEPSDKRTFKVHLTQEGKRLERVVVPILQETHQTIMTGISAEQFVELQDLITKMIKNIGGKKSMNIVTLVGSLRKDSYNLQLFKTIEERYQGKLNLTLADIRSLPYFDQDDENNPPHAVKEFKEAISRADGVMIITPEYNWSVPGVLKNALDWASRVDKVFIGKPVMALGATPGMLGTVRAQMHLREILSSPGIQAKILPPGGNEVLVGLAHQKFDQQTGRLVDEGTLRFIDEKVEAFIDFAKSV